MARHSMHTAACSVYIPFKLIGDINDAYYKDGNCASLSEFHRYVIRLFNEFIANHTTLKVGENCDKTVEELRYRIIFDGQNLAYRYRDEYGDYGYGKDWKMYSPIRITVSLTEKMLADVTLYSGMYGIKGIGEYIGIAFMWAVTYYKKMSDGNECITELTGERTLKEYCLRLTEGIVADSGKSTCDECREVPR